MRGFENKMIEENFFMNPESESKTGFTENIEKKFSMSSSDFSNVKDAVVDKADS